MICSYVYIYIHIHDHEYFQQRPGIAMKQLVFWEGQVCDRESGGEKLR